MTQPMKPGDDKPPSLADLTRIAEAAFATIPETLRRHTRDVVILLEDFPDHDTEHEMRLNSPFELLGLYRGVSIDRKSVHDVPDDVDMIFLYRRPILDYWCETEDRLEAIVRHVLIHEIGHHFGFSDDDMERIEATS
jgi:predicted Zn-dependent protease with MMP-like domain